MEGLIDWLEAWDKGELSGAAGAALSKGSSSRILTPARAPLAHEFDPWDLNVQMDNAYQGGEHPGTLGITFELLRRMSRITLIACILSCRINQAAEFAIPAESEDTPDPGFIIRLRDRKRSPSRAARRQIQEMQQWVARCGDERIHADPATFEAFIRALVRDSLSLDQGTFEVVPTRGGKPAGFLAVDAATIRRARLSDEERQKGRRDPNRVKFVQVIENKVTATYERGDLCFGIRNPRTDIMVSGYGHPELEDLIDTLISWMGGEQYNANNFRHGVQSAGVLALSSNMDKPGFRAFRRHFYALMSGAPGAHKTPLVQLDPGRKESLQWVGLGQTNKDMEYMQWMGHLMRLACAKYSMDPSEIGWQFGNEGQTQSLGDKGPAERIILSKERGLHPLLRAVESWINAWIIWPLDEDLEFKFVGLKGKTAQEKLAAAKDRVQHITTVNEERAREDLPPLDSPIANMPLNPSYINAALQLMQGAGGGDGDDNDGERADEGSGAVGQAGDGPPRDAPPQSEEKAGLDELNIDALFAGSSLDSGARRGDKDDGKG